MRNIYYLDLFAGAGGLSEGFNRAGFKPLVHVEKDRAACYTLKTRQVFNWLTSEGKEYIYESYINQKINRDELYSKVPEKVVNSVLNYEISNVNINEIFNRIDNIIKDKEISLIVGGPPCQAYSLVGRSRDDKKMIGDKRNYLYKYYAEFLVKYKPEYFVFENVSGLLSAKDIDGEKYLAKMKKLFEKSGYSTEFKVLTAKDYGVMQNRKRIILIGKKGKSMGFYPEIEKIKYNNIVSDLFYDLPKLKSGEGTNKAIKYSNKGSNYLVDSKIKNDKNKYITFHSSRKNNKNDLEIYEIAVKLWNKDRSRLSYNNLPTRLMNHRNKKSFLDRFKVVAGDMSYSHTVVAHISKDGHYYIHPDLKQNRSLTPREAARLQTFPDDYYFESISGKPSRTSAYKQIGNAVPVLMAEQIAKSIKKIL